MTDTLIVNWQLQRSQSAGYTSLGNCRNAKICNRHNCCSTDTALTVPNCNAKYTGSISYSPSSLPTLQAVVRLTKLLQVGTVNELLRAAG
jgi:hypothetical protein